MRTFVNVALVLACFVALTSATCTPTLDGKQYDFSPLTKSSSHYQVTDGDNHYTFELNVCGSVGSPRSSSCTGAVCQYDLTQNTSFVNVVGNWPYGSAGGWSMENGNVVLKMLNGDAGSTCANGGNRATAITFSCGTTEVGPLAVVESTNVNCLNLVTFPTSYGCASNAGTPSNGGGSDTGAWVFNGLLFFGLIFYFIIGCAYKWKKSNGEGTWRDWCPQYEFWMGLPGLMKDGCMYFFQLCKTCFAKVTGKGGETYEEVE